MENQAGTLTDKDYYEVSKTKKIFVKPQKSEEEVPLCVRRFVVMMRKANGKTTGKLDFSSSAPVLRSGH